MTRLQWAAIMMIGGLALASGCNQESFEAHRFMLSAERQGPASRATELKLAVRRFHSDSAFARQGLVLRVGDDKYEEAYYHKYMAPPAELVQDVTIGWFAASAAFDRVERSESSESGSLVLDADIISLYGDRRQGNTPTAFMAIRFTLSRVEDFRLITVFQQEYEARADWPPETLESLPAALNECLTDILKRVETDVLAKSGQ